MRVRKQLVTSTFEMNHGFDELHQDAGRWHDDVERVNPLRLALDHAGFCARFETLAFAHAREELLW